MKIRHFDKLRDQWDGKLIGVGLQMTSTEKSTNTFFHPVCMWQIYQGKLDIFPEYQDTYLIVFSPWCNSPNDSENNLREQLLCGPTLVNANFFYHQSEQTFVLESCPAIKLPHILQSAFPDAKFMWNATF